MSASRGVPHRLDRRARRSSDGRILTGGAPSRMIRLSAAGSAVLDGLLTGRPADGDPAAEGLRRRLRDAGLIHPTPEPRAGELTTVIPTRDGGPMLGRLAADLAREGEVIVVDDRSPDGSLEPASAAGARVLANAGAAGPAGARNTGLAAAETDIVAFVDADCAVGPGWSAPLVGLLSEDQGLALVAPRVRSAPGSSRLARFETAHSPLDLGPEPSLVGPGRRVSYVPAAALVARRSALLAVAGFDERLQVGEDVDLVWRLLAAGWSVRYAPEVEVRHQPRTTLGALARQRFGYGRSAATLERLHPGATAPLRASPGALASWLACVAGPRACAVAIGASAARASLLARDPRASRPLAALAVRGQLQSVRHLARVLAREWLPLSALLWVLLPSRRRLLAVGVTLGLVTGRRADAQPLGLPTRLGLRLLDNVSYSAGVWRGAAAERSAAAILPASVGGQTRRPSDPAPG